MRGIMLKLPMAFGLCLFLAVVLVGRNRATTEILEGTVIAYDDIKATTPCYRECEASLIVRIDGGGNRARQYVRIDLTFRNSSSFPRQLIARKRVWRFHVKRTNSLDEQLYDYIVQQRTPQSGERKYPIWQIVPGAEDEKLPFGQTLPSYSLIGKGFKVIR